MLEGGRRAFVRPHGLAAIDDWLMARFLHAPACEKAVALVVRPGPSGGTEPLALGHPSEGWQLPKGTLEPGEAPEEAVLRELAEASGVTDVGIRFGLSSWDQPIDAVAGAGRSGMHRLHAFVLHPTEPLPERWSWEATGSPEEEGLRFDFAWQPVPHASLRPAFYEVLCRLRAAFSG